VKNTRKSIYPFCSEIFRRWENSNSIEKHFVEQNSKRLNKNFDTPGSACKYFAEFADNIAFGPAADILRTN
jgi:hypothetical protein